MIQQNPYAPGVGFNGAVGYTTPPPVQISHSDRLAELEKRCEEMDLRYSQATLGLVERVAQLESRVG